MAPLPPDLSDLGDRLALAAEARMREQRRRRRRIARLGGAGLAALAVKALYGEMASIVTTGQRAVPARLEELGYRHRHPELEAALRDATGSRRAEA